MSKIVFSVLCVLLSFVMLFTFVRASFGQDPLTAREFVTEVSKISTDFTSTKATLVKLKALLNDLDLPDWQSTTLEQIDTNDVMFAYGWSASLPRDQCTVLDDGSVIAPNGFTYTKWEVCLITNDEVRIELYLSPRVWEGIFADWFGEDSGILSGIGKTVSYIVDMLGFFMEIVLLLLSIIDVVFAAVIDTAIFVFDCILLLLYFLGVDGSSTVVTA